jgi:hypothetical protein
MIVRFLADENFNGKVLASLLKALPDLVIFFLLALIRKLDKFTLQRGQSFM